MYTIERRSYGIALSFSGTSTLPEWQQFMGEFLRAVAGMPRPWHFLVDLRDSALLDQATFGRIAESLTNDGIRPDRVVLMVADPVLMLQVKRMARNANRQDVWEAIDASNDPNIERHAIRFLTEGVRATA